MGQFETVRGKTVQGLPLQLALYSLMLQGPHTCQLHSCTNLVQKLTVTVKQMTARGKGEMQSHAARHNDRTHGLLLGLDSVHHICTH